MKLSLSYSQLLNNNTCNFKTACQWIFQQYKTNNGQYARHTEQLLQLFRQMCGLQ